MDKDELDRIWEGFNNRLDYCLKTKKKNTSASTAGSHVNILKYYLQQLRIVSISLDLNPQAYVHQHLPREKYDSIFRKLCRKVGFELASSVMVALDVGTNEEWWQFRATRLFTVLQRRAMPPYYECGGVIMRF